MARRVIVPIRDFRFDWFSGTGAGGQHRNRSRNCLRLTHTPSGVTVVSQRERTRAGNRRTALKRMVRELRPWASELVKVEAPPRSTVVVRSYNFAENRVVDAASGRRWPARGFDIGDGICARRLGLLRKEGGRR